MILKNNLSEPNPDSHRPLPVAIQFSRFRGKDGVEEIQWMIRPTEYAHFDIQLKWVREAYEQAVQSMGLEMDSAVWRRFLCSDLINQEAALRGQSFSDPDVPNQNCAISWVRQVPAPPSKVTLWASHLRIPGEKLSKSYNNRTLSLKRKDLTHHWSTGITSPESVDSHAQTQGIFKKYGDFLKSEQMTLADHVVRTWFFVQNVDNNYAGMVDARNEVFEAEGLSADTHYIASTGIEGGYTDAPTNTLLDAYAIGGLKPEQIRYLHALKHLSPTHVYGVAFERATAIDYRDRTQIFISGTASIDDQGVTLHRGDIHRQLERTLENIEALLLEADATLDDMQVFIVYLRDPADEVVVRPEIARRFPELPFEIVTAPVCRPGWLIEIEGLAVIENDAQELPPF
ncbi:translation initiation inhibitor [Verrucomicrobiaceae bacterium N1E253]|uniref:Translation initiation inhibitor n=1 Tax=Oceaniferula marina TaxID=2748318 RepID=A0A851G9V9_9BACT|nr:translation initiation inhibitor [Oceaniferula marina]